MKVREAIQRAMRYAVVIERRPTGLGAFVPDLRGAFSLTPRFSGVFAVSAGDGAVLTASTPHGQQVECANS